MENKLDPQNVANEIKNDAFDEDVYAFTEGIKKVQGNKDYMANTKTIAEDRNITHNMYADLPVGVNNSQDYFNNNQTRLPLRKFLYRNTLHILLHKRT